LAGFHPDRHPWGSVCGVWIPKRSTKDLRAATRALETAICNALRYSADSRHPGQKDKALQWLETAYQQQAEWMVLLKVDPCFEDLRPDPRFQSLMRRMNFPA